MSAPWENDKQFKALKKEWDKKLKQKGFVDIEPKEGYLTKWSISLQEKYPLNKFIAQMEYYNFANQFIYDHTFDNDYDKQVWELHASGMTVRKIMQTLKKQKKSCYMLKVFGSIKKTKEAMMRFYKVKGDKNEE